jgi:cyclopropane fatty-acyl-phospholipid synthase-like methyltransferase
MNTFDFDELYRGVPPWEIGRPQDAVVELADLEQFRGHVLDVGCGCGENALFLAQRGYDVVGIDVSSRAIEQAQEKAQLYRRMPRFLVADALQLERLNGTFDTVLDCGFLHLLTDEARPLYLRGLGQVMPPGALLHVICFSDDEPEWGGPRRLSRTELEELGSGFFLEDLAPVRFETTLSLEGARAWRATYAFGGSGPVTLQ